MTARTTDGFLLVDKPAGMSSHTLVAAVRRALGIARAGHTGTLDPFATGLLIVLAGRATRLARFVPAEPKVYDALVRFGSETDTDDLTGEVTRTAGLPDESSVRRALAQQVGVLQQVPPAYSAKQVDGQRAYAAARRGDALELPPVSVTVNSIDVLDAGPDGWRLRITCGTGTYIRAIARDVGRLAGSAAHLASLRRTRIGPFDIAGATMPDRLGEAVTLGALADAVPDLPRQVLTEADLGAVRHGRRVGASVPGEMAALVSEAGDLLAIAARVDGAWQPEVVLVDA